MHIKTKVGWLDPVGASHVVPARVRASPRTDNKTKRRVERNALKTNASVQSHRRDVSRESGDTTRTKKGKVGIELRRLVG